MACQMRAYTFIDLFSGCGGLALGFKQAGFRSVYAVEMDADAAKTYQLNFGHRVAAKPIDEVTQLPVGALRADVIVGGPPCQGFSPLGRMSPRAEHADMNGLWEDYLRIVDLVKPKAFVLENVPQFLKSQEGASAVEALSDASTASQSCWMHPPSECLNDGGELLSWALGTGPSAAPA